jgi:ectoine hydroxylase-related dioxygenase (phytanoyl-CoA dioxygenase family)
LNVDELNKKGFIGPFDLFNITALDELLCDFKSLANSFKDRHVDNDIIKCIILDHTLQSKISTAFGKDLLLWRTNFFVKQQDSGIIPWHHDRHFEDGDTSVDFSNLKNHFSILIAVTDMTEKEGIMEFIPYSHNSEYCFERDIRPYHLKPGDEHFVDLPNEVTDNKIQIPLRKGQFLIFHSGLLHRSLSFEGNNRRVSMIGRLVRKGTTIPSELVSSNAVISFN